MQRVHLCVRSWLIEIKYQSLSKHPDKAKKFFQYLTIRSRRKAVKIQYQSASIFLNNNSISKSFQSQRPILLMPSKAMIAKPTDLVSCRRPRNQYPPMLLTTATMATTNPNPGENQNKPISYRTNIKPVPGNENCNHWDQEVILPWAPSECKKFPEDSTSKGWMKKIDFHSLFA